MIGYRKLFLGIIYIISCVVLLILGYLPGNGWMDAMSTAVAAFFGANLVERVTDVIKDKLNG